MKKLGIALSGGGGKGAYQVGVWRALEELGITKNIKAISGSSVGALNGALFISGNSYEAEEIWLERVPERIKAPNFQHIIPILVQLAAEFGEKFSILIKWIRELTTTGVLSRNGLKEIIREDVSTEKLVFSSIDFFVTCVEIEDTVSSDSNEWNKISYLKHELKDLLKQVTEKSPTYFHINKVESSLVERILLASSALPAIYPSEKINDKRYRDGGLLDNIPVQPLYDFGCNVIIVVYLDRISTIDKTKYPNTIFIEIMPQEDQGNFIKGTLDFSKEGSKRRIDQGYKDAMAVLKPIYEMFKTQKEFTQTAKQVIATQNEFNILTNHRNERSKKLREQFSHRMKE